VRGRPGVPVPHGQGRRFQISDLRFQIGKMAAGRAGSKGEGTGESVNERMTEWGAGFIRFRCVKPDGRCGRVAAPLADSEPSLPCTMRPALRVPGGGSRYMCSLAMRGATTYVVCTRVGIHLKAVDIGGTAVCGFPVEYHPDRYFLRAEPKAFGECVAGVTPEDPASAGRR
jgi:hypothetical protein